MEQPESLLIRDGVIVTMNDRLEIVEGDVSIRGRRIEAIGARLAGRYDRTIDARGGYVLPGLVQTHVHLCQTLFRGFADDLPLLEWLRARVWPMEAALTAATMRAAARLGIAELLSSGTTTVLTMETVHETDVAFEVAQQTGIRATIGKCMMDRSGEAPVRLQERTNRSIDESLALWKRWNGAADGRLRAAFAPRFAISCTQDLLEAVAALSAEHAVLVHTHAAESRDEVALVRELSNGLTNVEYLASLQLASPRLCTAHCVWVDAREIALMAEHDVKVMHCPGSNLKLGSGLAPVTELRAAGVTVSLGTDGGACNNRLDMFDEMRLAATVQAVRAGAGTLPARSALWMATRAGARTLGLEQAIGSLEVGKRADVIVVDRGGPHLAPDPDPYSTLVYAAQGTDVRTTIVDGEVLVHDFSLVHMDPAEVAAEARQAGRTIANSLI
jgi:cytosine/adenosine deaminase-related metal-dependent hydrolase